MKHLATVDGNPLYTALWTAMDSSSIRGQVFTFTKSHEERVGPFTSIAESCRLYGYKDPDVFFTDDPIKVFQFKFFRLCFQLSMPRTNT